jgi:predicted outer membrane protein
MARGIRRLRSLAVLVGATLCMALSGCTADEISVGAPNKPEQPMEQLSTGQIASVVVTINQTEVGQAQTVVGRIEDEKVRAFVDELLIDHRDADAEFSEILGQLGVQQESSVLRSEIEQLAQKMNELVAQETLERIEVTFLDTQIRMHKKSLGAVEQLLAQAQEPELRTIVEELRATERQHLETALKLRKPMREPNP